MSMLFGFLIDLERHMIYGWPVLPECEAQYEVGSMRHVNALRTRSLRATPGATARAPLVTA